MRVLLIAPDIPDYSVAFAEAVAQVAEVVLIAPRSFFTSRRPPEAPGLTVHQIDWPRHRSLGNPRFISQLLQLVRSSRADYIHVLSEKNVWLNLAFPFMQRPILTTVHDVQYHPGDLMSQRVPSWCTRLVIRQSDGIVVHGASLSQQAANEFGIDPRGIYVLPHLALYQYRRFAESLGLRRPAASPPTILFYGRIQGYKGIDVLLAAAPEIIQACPSVRIVIAGRSDENTGKQLVGLGSPNFDVRDRFISDAETAELFTSADMVVLPYTEASQSGVLAIANTFGLPAVVSDVGELGITVREAQSGFVVPPEDPAALARAIIAMLDSPEQRRQFGDNALAAANTTHSPRQIGSLACAIYASLGTATKFGVRIPRVSKRSELKPS